MTAITPHLEEQDDPSVTPEEREWFHQTPQTRIEAADLIGDLNPPYAEQFQMVAGVGALKPGSKEAFARKAQHASHARLMRTSWTRRAIEEALVGRSLRVILGNDLPKAKRPSNVDVNDVILQLDEPIFDPVYNAPGTGIRNVALLSWTSKMSCPSFSLPAGPAAFGGACPAADGGQTIVPERKLRRAQLPVVDIQGPVDTLETVCQWCYAEGGNYRFGSNQLNQVLRMVWARQAVRDGSFEEVMGWAVQNADYRIDGDGRTPPERFLYTDDAGENQVIRFFRIHDSGDFFNKEYLSAWIAVARANPGVQFWAPTRIWAKPELGALVQRYDPPRNLIIRPSSYMVDRPADAGLWSFAQVGYAGPTTVYDKRNKPAGAFQANGDPYHWDCQAYATVGENHTCRHALSPPTEGGGDGEVGCRACWLHPELSVNYTKH